MFYPLQTNKPNIYREHSFLFHHSNKINVLGWNTICPNNYALDDWQTVSSTRVCFWELQKSLQKQKRVALHLLLRCKAAECELDWTQA